MHVLRDVLAVARALWDVMPAGLAFVCQHAVRSVLPSEEASHALVQFPRIAFFIVVKPVSLGSVEIGCPDVNELRELILQPGEDVVKGQCVCRQMDPTRVCCEQGKGLTRPQSTTVDLPACNIGVVLLCLRMEGIDVDFPR